MASSLNDCMLAAVTASTGLTDLNDGLRAHYLLNGATGNLGDQLQDLEYEFLRNNGAVGSFGDHVNDLWAEVLPGAVGFQDQLNDMLIVFWCQGGTFAPPDPPLFDGPIPDQTAYEEATTTLDCRQFFDTGGYISQWSLLNAPAWVTIGQYSGVLRMVPGFGELDATGVIVVGTNVTGPPAQSNAFTVFAPANVAITFNPQSQFVEIGSSVTFSVGATEATAYQWYRNGSPISGATSFAYTTPPIAQADDLSQYMCRVEGHGGVFRDTTAAVLTAMETFLNRGLGGPAVVQITLATGVYTLSMLGSGLTTIRGISATIVGL